MTCQPCVDAKDRPNSATFGPGCHNCIARALAVTGAHLESSQAGAITEQYRAALDRCFGARWQEGHAMVKEWAALVRQKKARAV